MAGNSTQIRAGQAYVELGAKDDKLAAALKSAEKKLKAWGKAISHVGKELMGIGGAALTGLAGLGMTFADNAEAAGKLAARTGIALDTVQGLAGAVGGPEALEEAIGHMNKTMYEAADGGAEAQETLARLGTTAQQLASMPADAALMKLADGLANVQGAGTQAALAEKAFGRSVGDMAPILAKGSAFLKERAKHFGEHHPIATQADVNAAKEFNLALGDLNGSFQKALYAIGKAVIPMLQGLIGYVVPIIENTVTWISENTGLIQTIAEVAGGVLAAGVALYALGEAFSVVGAAASIAGTLVTVATSPWFFLPALAVAVVGSLLYLGGAFDGLADTATEAWGGIVDAIKAGDLTLSGRIAVKGLEIAWLGFRNYFLNLWDDIRIVFAYMINEIWRAWDQLVTSLKIAWVGFRMLIHVTGKEAGKQELARLAEEQKANNVAADDRMDHAVKTVQDNKAARQGDLDDAKAQLKELSQTASKEAKKAREPKAVTPPPAAASMGMPGLMTKGESIGSFSAAAAGGLGYGSSIGSQLASIAQSTASTAASNQVIAANMAALGAVG